MPFGYPISLELEGRRAVVIGELAVRERKHQGLLAAGADVTIVAEEPSIILDALETEGRVKVLRRRYEPGDLADAFVCVAGPTDEAERDAIWTESRERRVLTNIIDDIPHCDWAAPALVRRGDLVLAISTGGRSPALARKLREDLSLQFGPEWTDMIEVLGDVREETLQLLPDMRDRARRWQRALDLDELRDLVRAGEPHMAAERIKRRLLEGIDPAGADRTGS